MLAIEGIEINRSTLADWVGIAAFELAPLHDRLVEILKASTKLFAEDIANSRVYTAGDSSRL